MFQYVTGSVALQLSAYVEPRSKVVCISIDGSAWPLE